MTAQKSKNTISAYSVGLDIGTGSVGWVAIDDNYRLKRAKGNELIGVRLFDSAESAANRRASRTTRRRLSRRRWRVSLLQGLFAPEMAQIDESFFARMKWSWVHPKDTQNREDGHFYAGSLFGKNDVDKEFYKKYPNIYQLRYDIAHSQERFDLREIYLAIHHIIKFRGNFLREGELDTTEAFDINAFVTVLKTFATLEEDGENAIEHIDTAELMNQLTDSHLAAQYRADKAYEAITFSSNEAEKILKPRFKAILRAVVGKKADIPTIFGKEKEWDSDTREKHKLQTFESDEIDEKVEEIIASGDLEDDEIQILQELLNSYKGLALKELLGDTKSISEAKIRLFKIHRDDWEYIKKNLRTKDNRKEVNQQYNAYLGFEAVTTNERRHSLNKTTQEKAFKTSAIYFHDLLATLDESQRTQLPEMLRHFIEEDKNFERINIFPKLRTSDNGVIPYQLHLNELRAIIRNQSKYYPFLSETVTINGKSTNKIEQLLTFRIPYYVGPLVEKEIVKLAGGDGTNHWMIRKSHEDKTTITPWNFHEVVDTDASGAEFIHRLTGTDSYLIGEPTVPKNSLLYQKYEVLNELNNVRKSVRTNTYNDKYRERLTFEEKQLLIDTLFKKHKTVSINAVKNALRSVLGQNCELFGLADERQFLSSMTSYIKLNTTFSNHGLPDFVGDIKNTQLLETIIELQTVYEDKAPLIRQLSALEIPNISGTLKNDLVTDLAKTHYTGWGRLSAKLLTTLVAEVRVGDDISPRKHSIIDLLEDRAENFMEIITNADYGIGLWITSENDKISTHSSREDLIADLVCSPSVKRGINQSLKVLDDITKALGAPPEHVYLEFARDTQTSQRTISRKRRLEELYKDKSINSEFNSIKEKLSQESDNSLQDDRLYLYYTQLGKDMYTGKALKLDRISSDYDIDHIIPQSYTKDNSLDNRVLVSRVENARKTNSAILSEDIRRNCDSFWIMLKKHNLISQRKYDRLTRKTEFSENEKERFIARALVETRQIIKNVSELISSEYKGTTAVAVPSAQTKDMRQYLGIEHKNRDINDYHHAQDALCVAVVGKYIERKGFFKAGKLSDAAGNVYNRYTNNLIQSAREYAEKRELNRINPLGFVVRSMKDESIDEKTGEVIWDESYHSYLQKVTQFRKMLVSKRVEDITGALFDESRYGASAAEGSIPFNKLQSDTALYGGFSGQSPSFASLIETKGKYRLVKVMITEASQVLHNHQVDVVALTAKLRERYPDAQVILPHVRSNQLIIKSGARMTVKSAAELNNAQQLWLPKSYYVALDIILSNSDVDKISRKLNDIKVGSDADKVACSIFSLIGVQVKKYYPLNKADWFTEKLDFFEQLPLIAISEKVDKQSVLLELIHTLHADNKTGGNATQTVIGKGGNRWGRQNERAGTVLSSQDCLIFQSTTGIFEKVISVKELASRLN